MAKMKDIEVDPFEQEGVTGSDPFEQAGVTTSELALRGAHDLALQGTVREEKVILGLEEFTQEDIRPLTPRLQLLQSIAEEVQNGSAEAGTFRNSLTGENYGRKLLIQPVIAHKGRNLWEGKKRQCFSDDFLRGIGEPGGECSSCPMSQWSGAEPPACSVTIYWFALNPQQPGDFFAYPFQRTGLSTAKRIAALCLRYQVNPWWLIMDVRAEFVKGDKGNYFVPVVEVARFATKEEATRGYDLYAQFTSIVDFAVHMEDIVEAQAGEVE